MREDGGGRGVGGDGGEEIRWPRGVNYFQCVGWLLIKCGGEE